MTTDIASFTPLQSVLYIWGFNNFRWFRAWIGGHWYSECSLGYALSRGLHRWPGAYVTRQFTVVFAEEHYE